MNNLFKVSSEPWSPNTKFMLSGPQTSIPFHELSSLCLWIHPAVPEGWLCGCCLSLSWHSAALVRAQLWFWGVLGPQSRDRRTADSAVVSVPVRLLCVPVPENPCAVQPWLQEHSAMSQLWCDIRLLLWQSLNFLINLGQRCGIIKVDPFCRASRKKIHYYMRRSKRAKVENICVPSTAV